MIKVLQNRQRLVDDFTGLLAFNVDDESDAAGIVLEPRIIKALLGRQIGKLHISVLRCFDRSLVLEKKMTESHSC